MTLAIGEPLLGSAGTAVCLVAIAWPKPLWDPDEAARSVGLPEELAATLVREKDTGEKLAIRVFQRSPRPSTQRVELICVAPGQGRSLHLVDLPTAQLPTHVESFLRGDDSGPPLERRVVLACTDGRHDRCCAEHGRAFFDSLDERVRARGAELSIAESSHLGGHRFAATCIVLPEGRMYGRLRPEHADAVVDAAAADKVWLPHYRGRLGLAEPAQVAEACALERFPDALRVDVGAPLGGEGDDAVRVPVDVEAEGARHALSVRCAPRDFTSATSCAPDAEPETRRRWLRADVSSG